MSKISLKVRYRPLTISLPYFKMGHVQLLKSFYIVVILCSFPLSSSSQHLREKFLFEPYVIDIAIWEHQDGLPYFYDSTIDQDKNGFLWMATTEGVCCFDGINFRCFPFPYDFPIPTNYTYCTVDKNGNIWVLTHRNNKETSCIIFDSNNERYLSCLEYTGTDLLNDHNIDAILKAKDTIYLFNRFGDGWKYDGQLKTILSTSEKRGVPCSFYPTKNENEFWEINHNLFDNSTTKYRNTVANLINSSGERLAQIEIPFTFSNDLHLSMDEELNLRAIFLDQKNNFKISLLKKDGLAQEGNDFLLDKNFLLLNLVSGHSIYKTGSGVAIQKSSTNYGQVFQNEELILEDLEQLLNLDVKYNGFLLHKSGFIDANGNYWFLCFNSLIKITFNQNPFTTIAPNNNNTSYSIRSITPIDDNSYLIGTYKSNYIYKKGQFSLIDIPKNQYTTIWAASKYLDDIYMGTEYLELLKYHTKTQKVKKVRLLKNRTQEESVQTRDLYLQENGKLLLGGNEGVIEIDTSTLDSRLVGLSDTLVTFFKPTEKHLWVGTEFGLLDWESRTFHLASSKDIGALSIAHIYEDTTDNSLWMASSQGLVHWSPEDGHPKIYTTKDGLSVNNLHCVYPDKNGNLWMSSNHGLMKFNKQLEKAVVYFEKDGLPTNEFNRNAHYMATDGTLFLGTIAGIVKFHPDVLKRDDSTLLFDLQFDSLATFDADYKQLMKYSDEGKLVSSIKIPKQSKQVSIHFSIPYYGTKELVYEYRINGEHTHWSTLNAPHLTLRNLGYGTFEVQLRAYEKNGPPNHIREKKITIIKIRPFYLRIWFITLMIILGGGLIALVTTLFYRYDNRRLNKLVDRQTQELKESSELVKGQKEELEALVKSKNRFVTNISHDYRTPLSLIVGSLDLLQQQELTNQDRREYLDLIESNTKKLIQLNDQLINIATVDKGELDVDLEAVKWGLFFERIASTFKTKADAKQISYLIKNQVSKDEVIMIDKHKIERIINNLIDNALKFTPPKGEIYVESNRVINDQIQVTIKDNGPGIKKEEKVHIFKRYFQGVSAQPIHQTGLGIGLSICIEYARLIKAKLWVEDTPGGGATFCLAFPIIAANPSIVLESGGTTPNLVQQPLFLEKPYMLVDNQNPHKLLLVEDNQNMLQFLKHALEDDYQLILAPNGKVALEVLKKYANNIDLILSDAMMPELDGFELLKLVRADNRYALIPVILLTALSQEKNRQKAIRLGVDSYVTKPFRIVELKTQINNLLSLRAERRKFLIDNIINQNKQEEQSLTYDEEWLLQLEQITEQKLSASNLRINHISDALYISERQLRLKIKALTGLTPTQYLTKARLRKALILLEAQKHGTIAEVCYAVGFKNPAHFSQAFKKEFGLLPSNFIDQNRLATF